MPVLLAILEAIGSLVGPLTTLVHDAIKLWADWHAQAGVSEDQIAADATAAASHAVAAGYDTESAISTVKVSLQTQHTTIPAAHATAVAAMAVGVAQAKAQA